MQRGRSAVDDLVAETGNETQAWDQGSADEIADFTAGGHRPTDGQRQADHVAGVWLSLLLVCVQHAGRQAAGQDPGELPGQVHRVAQAGSHALPDERRSQMRGIAEQKDVAPAPPVGELGAEGVLRHPDQLQIAPAEPGRPTGRSVGAAHRGRRSRPRFLLAAAGTPNGSGYGRCACRWRRGPDRRPGARRPTGRGPRWLRCRRPASAGRTSGPASSCPYTTAQRCSRRRSRVRSSPRQYALTRRRDRRRSTRTRPCPCSATSVTSTSPRNSTHG